MQAADESAAHMHQGEGSRGDQKYPRAVKRRDGFATNKGAVTGFVPVLADFLGFTAAFLGAAEVPPFQASPSSYWQSQMAAEVP
jgi:hypothetical protein